MAKTPAKKNAAAANKAQGRPSGSSGARKAPNRPANKPSAGRPAGLFTWLAIGLVVVVVATLVIIKVSGGNGGTNGTSGFTATDPAMVAQLTKIPESVFDTVGVNSQVVQVSAPIKLKNQPELTATSATGPRFPKSSTSALSTARSVRPNDGRRSSRSVVSARGATWAT